MLKISRNPAHLPTHPDRGPLRGGRVAASQPVHETFVAQDGVLGHGARIVATVGLAGLDAFMADASIDPEEGTQTHPRFDVYRVVLRCKVLLTPGYSLRFRGTFVKSGIQQTTQFGDWPYVGAGGAVKCAVSYTNGVDTLAQTRVMTPLASPNVNGDEPTAEGASFADLHTQDFELYPPLILFDAVVARRWSEETTATITVSYKGSPRVVDLVVYETPVPYARNTAFDQQDEYTIPLHTDGAGKPLGTYPSPWPLTQRAETVGGDISSGTRMALAIAGRQAARLGPVVFFWSSFQETLAPADTEAAYVDVTSQDFVELRAGHVTSWRAEGPGHAAGSPGMARRADIGGPLELRDVAAVLPVRVRVYGRTTDGDHPGEVRIAAAGYSVAEVKVSGAAFAWYEQRGWLKCGLNGDDPQTWQVFARGTESDACHVRYIVVEFEPQA